MANYGNQQGGGPPQYGQPTGGARDAAFANIFGASPSMAGRSQTMTSQSVCMVCGKPNSFFWK